MKKIITFTFLGFILLLSCEDKKKDPVNPVVDTEIPFSIYGSWLGQNGAVLMFDTNGQAQRSTYSWKAEYTYKYVKQKPNPYILFTDKSIWKIVSRWDIHVLDTNKFCQVQYPNIVYTKGDNNIPDSKSAQQPIP